MSKSRLIVFIKNPEIGKVKTRLAKSIGDQGAYKVYQLLIRHTKQVIAQLNVPTAIYYSSYIDESDSWANNPTKYVQAKGDLGFKMSHAFKDSFEIGMQKTCIIGSDCLMLQPHHIRSAFKALDDAQVVFGPAKDGGYYLLGMNQYYPALFKNIPWSTSEVLRESLKIANNLNCSYQLLETLSDVDEKEDLPEDILNKFC